MLPSYYVYLTLFFFYGNPLTIRRQRESKAATYGIVESAVAHLQQRLGEHFLILTTKERKSEERAREERDIAWVTYLLIHTYLLTTSSLLRAKDGSDRRKIGILFGQKIMEYLTVQKLK